MLIGVLTNDALAGVLVIGCTVKGATPPQERLRLAKLLPSPEQRGPRGGAMNLLGSVA